MILIENKVVIAVMDTFTEQDGGNLINGSVYMTGKVIDIPVPLNITPQKWCYDESKGFYENPVWLQSQDKAIQDAIDAYNLELIEGGLL